MVSDSDTVERRIAMNEVELKVEMLRNKETQTKLAAAMGMQPSNLNDRIKGKTEFRQSEINFIRKRYNLSAARMEEIFFA